MKMRNVAFASDWNISFILFVRDFHLFSLFNVLFVVWVTKILPFSTLLNYYSMHFIYEVQIK